MNLVDKSPTSLCKVFISYFFRIQLLILNSQLPQQLHYFFLQRVKCMEAMNKRLSDIKLFFNLWLGSFSKCLLWYHIPSLKVLLVTQLAKILILILRHFYPLRLSERTSALFVSGLCRWPGCDALSEDFPSFLK